MSPRTHWGTKAPDDAMYLTACARLMPTVAEHPEDVDCKPCKAAMARHPDEKLRAHMYVEQMAQFPKPLPSRCGPESVPLPPLVMEQPKLQLQRYARCTCGMCEACLHFAAIEKDYAGRLRQVRHKLGEQRFRFAHVVQALEWFADLNEDEGLRRYGSVLSRIQEQGVRVQGSDMQLAPMERLAWYAGAIKTALDACYLEPDRGLTRQERLELLYRCAIGPRTRTKRGSVERTPVAPHRAAQEAGHGLDAQGVGRIVREGLSTVYQVLRGKGLVG